ncbi:ATP-binding protein [Methanohalophilus sp.]|uniref:ATP-binding protein n=1 Tax=Methanohalophilus sp. TaxID=1966352 RepID=UPI002621924D|nr:ATP-binding protein [Methanohalophilus sp.]MDK2891654.1 hypothetical protein [Methanohalophilus sp.]
MKIAVASGKGGTGKTTVAVNLALSLQDIQLLDCDVEEPNANLFLQKSVDRVEDVSILVPQIDDDLCNCCGDCVAFCQYNALAALPNKVMVFESLCHGCGGCKLVCPEKAITETGRNIGYIEKSSGNGLDFYHGILCIGDAMASPLIQRLKCYADENKTIILDAPPGTACPMITTLKDVDYCILVTEPTPFGLHDLKLAVEVVEKMSIPAGIIINQDAEGYSEVEEFCKSKNIPIILRIPYDRRIAEMYSKGIPFAEELPGWKEKFREMYEQIKRIIE